MSKRNALFVLTLSALLFAFAAGVLVSRPTTAQGVVGYLGMPMRQADLWSFVATEASAGRFPLAWGGELDGCGFSVERDAQGRLPVLTQMLVNTWNNSGAGLYRRGPDGLYRLVWARSVQDSSMLTPGFTLQPGSYATGGVATSQAEQLVLVGYWARP